MKFDKETQETVARLISGSLGCSLVSFSGKMAIPDNGRYPARDPAASADSHRLEIKLQLQKRAPLATVALLFNSVPDRVYQRTFALIDKTPLELIERVNAYMQDRMAEPTDGEISCMLYVPEMDKQPEVFPAQFVVVGDFYF